MNLRDLVYIPLALVTLPKWGGKKREGWDERFGKIDPLPAKGERRRVLLHAVSVGEVSALRTIVPLLIERGLDIVVSATTDTGLKRAKELFGTTCHVRRYPLDLSWAVARFLDAVNPDAVALVELELWPNFMQACTTREVPVCVINGRLSKRSFNGYRKIRPLLRRTFASLSFAAVQDEEYRERFISMGVPFEKCIVAGSVKWDNATIVDEVPGAAELAHSLGIDRSKPLIVAGSTGPISGSSEEAMLHAACPPGVQLLCAPRKPERFDEAAAALPGCVRRSRANEAGSSPSGTSDRFLLDSIGELRQAYSLADVVVVGRSFGDLYGSDPLEPIGLGKPTVIGPAVSDFATIVSALESDRGILRATPQTIAQSVTQLLGNKTFATDLAAGGRRSIRKHQGASQRQAQLVTDLATLVPGRGPQGAA